MGKYERIVSSFINALSWSHSNETRFVEMYLPESLRSQSLQHTEAPVYRQDVIAREFVQTHDNVDVRPKVLDTVC